MNEPFRADPDDPASAWTPVIITATGPGGPVGNALVVFQLNEPTNTAPEPGEEPAFCDLPDIASCVHGPTYHAYTDQSGQALAYIRFGTRTWGGDPADNFVSCPGVGGHYLTICGQLEISAVVNPETAGSEISLSPGSFPHDIINMRPGEPANIEVVADGMNNLGSWFLYAETPGWPKVAVEDTFGNPLANALVKFEVTQGGGKLMNLSARYCRDNTGDPFTLHSCAYDEAAFQSVEVASVLDDFSDPRFGPHDCACTASGNTVTCPPGWDPDEQCSSFTWWAGNVGEVMANWLMGPLPAGESQGWTGEAVQQIEVSIVDNSTVSHRFITVNASDLPAHEMIPAPLVLSFRSNDYVQFAGEIDIVFDKALRDRLRVVLMMDNGGWSMDPYVEVCTTLFAYARDSFKELRTFYFHNCIYDRVWEEPMRVRKVIRTLDFSKWDPETRLVIVGDASMAPYELLGPDGSIYYYERQSRSGIKWLEYLHESFPHSVWLNPKRKERWEWTEGSETIAHIRKVFPMFDLTIEGLGQAVEELKKQRL